MSAYLFADFIQSSMGPNKYSDWNGIIWVAFAY